MRRSIGVATLLAATVSAHGNVTSPPARLPGPAMVQACGQTATGAVMADGTTPLEDVKDPLASCKLDLCRGAVFADNKSRVQTFRPGQVVPMTANISIPHEGPANVSIVNTATNKIVGNMLLVFDSYADEKLKVLPPNNTQFSVTLPTNLGKQCSVAGECVLQWFWFGTAAKQTYESCVDFVLAGNAVAGGGGSAGGSAGGSTGTGSSSTGGSSSTTGGDGAGAGIVAGAPIPGTGEGSFGGVEGSVPASQIGQPMTEQAAAGMANMPDMPMANMPDMPNMPNMPDTPIPPTPPTPPANMPNTPGLPNTPDMPGMPNMPNTPDMPNMPGMKRARRG